MQTFQADLTIVGAGGMGLHAVIAATQANPNAKVALTSEVYPMHNHTAAVEGGSAVVTQDRDSFECHFHDTIMGGDWLYEQGVVDYFVHHCPAEMAQLEPWGCPWNRCPDGDTNIHHFGDMKTERTWFAADKTGFHMLHILFQTPLQFPQVQRPDEHFALDILVDDDHVHGLVATSTTKGMLVQIRANAVVIATGGMNRVYRYNTNGGIIADDGMGVALSHGIPLRDMELAQYHPTGLPGSGVLMTESYRGEGGILVNKSGYRYLQDYGVGPETPLGEPKNKYMKLGPRDKVSQAFWYEWRRGNTISTPRGDVAYLDLRHLGEKRLRERLPFICGLARAYAGVDPVREPIPVCPTACYTMGGIETDQNCETHTKGLFAVGECSSIGLHGTNHLGFDSLAGSVIFGRLAGKQATERAATAGNGNEAVIKTQTAGVKQRLKDLINQDDGESWAKIRDEMGLAMEKGRGVYRTPGLVQKTIDKLTELQERFKHVRITDTSNVFSTDLLYTIELGHGLNVAECMVHSAVARKESRDAHQRSGEGCAERDDVNPFKHTLVLRDANGTACLEYSDVKITTLSPAKRAYDGEADVAGKAEAANKKEKTND